MDEKFIYFNLRVHSFNGKTSVSKTAVPGSSPGGPAQSFKTA